MHFLVCISHNLIAAFPSPLARILPAGQKATPSTQVLCSSRVAMQQPVDTSQSLMVLSLLQLAKILPSGVKAIAQIQFHLSLKNMHTFTCLHIPQSNRAIAITRCCENIIFRAKSNSPNPIAIYF